MTSFKRNDNFIIREVNNDINWKIINKILNIQILEQLNKSLMSDDESELKVLEDRYREKYGKFDWTDEWFS